MIGEPFDVERIRAAVVAYLVAPDPDTGEVYETEGWRVEVRIEPADVDEETGEFYEPARPSVTAYDLGHHSNVLSVEMDETGYNVLRIE